MCLKQILGFWRSSDKVIFVGDGFFPSLPWPSTKKHLACVIIYEHLYLGTATRTSMDSMEKSKFDFTRMLETTKQLKNSDLAFEKMFPRLAHVDSFSSKSRRWSRHLSLRKQHSKSLISTTHPSIIQCHLSMFFS